MPRQPVLHMNPPSANDGKTLCGRVLAKVKWTLSLEDVSCNNCLRVATRIGTEMAE